MIHLDAEEATRRVEATVRALAPEHRGCAMCAIARGGHDASLVVKRDATGTVLIDRFAAERGHLLVVLNAHREHVAELEWPAYAALQRLAWEASRALTRVLKPRRIFVAALGASAPLAKTFPHLHLHVVPLPRDAKPADVFTWSRGVYVYEPGEGETLARCLAAETTAKVRCTETAGQGAGQMSTT